MLSALLFKDLLRAWRNPLPWLINLALPLCITALIGLVFGEKKQETALGRVRMAIVDEDDSLLTGALRGAVTRQAAMKYLDPAFIDRETALREINANKIAGVLIIPTNFTRDYFAGRSPVKLELVKNPAQSVHPAVLEELFGALVTALNAVARNFPWQSTEGGLDQHKIAGLVVNFGNEIQAARKYLLPPLVTYENAEEARAETPTNRQISLQNGISNAASNTSAPKPGSNETMRHAQSATAKAAKAEPGFGIFGYILVGMSAMFLLFIASNAMTDLQRELRFRTFARYQTMRQHLIPFVLAKVMFAVVLLLLCSAIMLIGGGLAFRVHWQQPLTLSLLTFGYAIFAAGLMAALVALMPGERRSSTLNDIVGMLLSMAGGCMFPTRQLPEFLREHISPMLPSYWYVETARNLQFGNQNVAWGLALLKLVALGALLMIGATLLFRRRFKTGLR